MKYLHFFINSFKFTIKNYKYLFLAILLLFFEDFFTDSLYLTIPKEYFVITLLIDWIIFFIVIGITYEMVYNLIKQERISFNVKIHHLAHGFKDNLLDSFYMSLSYVITIFLILPFTFLHMDVITDFLLLSEDFEMNFADYIWSLSDVTKFSFIYDLIIVFIILSLVFITCFTLLMIAKIHLEETGNLKESLNIFFIFKKVKKLGFLRFLETVLIMVSIFFILSNVVGLLHNLLSQSLISAIFEALVIFINLRIFTYLYDDANLNEAIDTSI